MFQGYEGGGYQQPAYGGHNNYDAPMNYMAQPPQQTRDHDWVQRGCPVQGPNGWTEYRSQETGEAYYNNSHTGLTQWERPQEWAQ